MTDMKKIAVYCASSDRVGPVYKQMAFDVGAHIAEMGATVVYGGGGVSLIIKLRKVLFSEAAPLLVSLPSNLKR